MTENIKAFIMKRLVIIGARGYGRKIFHFDLVEAISLGHDVGNTPFGHVGERTITTMIRNYDKIPDDEKGFKHNLQALRLLCHLEKGADYPLTKGLNHQFACDEFDRLYGTRI